MKNGLMQNLSSFKNLPALDFLAAGIERGETTGIGQLFIENGTAAPHIKWSPQLEDLKSEELASLLRYWESLRKDHKLPFSRQVDPYDMQLDLGHVMLMDVLDHGYDFRYCVYGADIARRYGRDMTGWKTSAIGQGNYIASFFLAGYKAVVQKQMPLFTRHVPPPWVNVQEWHRLILPLAGEDGAVSRLLVGYVAAGVRRAGGRA